VRGDQSACSMVDALRAPLVTADLQPRTASGQAQTTRNVAAIMDGEEGEVVFAGRGFGGTGIAA
jgi:hypothetical protein